MLLEALVHSLSPLRVPQTRGFENRNPRKNRNPSEPWSFPLIHRWFGVTSVTMRILVTGAAGFIGSSTVGSLLDKGHEVIGLDNFDPFYDRGLKERNIASALQHESFRFVEGDLLDAPLVTRLLAEPRCDAVVHIAALAGVHPSLERPLDYQRVNVRGSMVLLEACRSAEVSRVILASSSSVYGVRSEVPFSETDPCDRPASPYAATKRAMEIIAYNYHHLYGLPITCLRYFTVYGPRQRPEMAVAKFVRKIRSGELITLFGDGSSARDYTYIDDIVAGTVAALNRCRDGYQIYNIGGRRTTSLRRLVELIEQAVGKPARVNHIDDQPGDVPITCADTSRAEQDLDYRPRVGIEDGIQRYVDWIDSQP